MAEDDNLEIHQTQGIEAYYLCCSNVPTLLPKRLPKWHIPALQHYAINLYISLTFRLFRQNYI